MKSSVFKKNEILVIVILGLILGMRQIAVGIVTPFIVNYTIGLKYGTVALGGIALGITSLSKGVFQVPFGNLGDKIGNKKVIFVGLALLMGGLFTIVFSNNAYMFMIGRTFQGAGAIVGAGYALLSNIICEDKRTEAISLVSVMVGIFSALSLSFGPVLRDFMSIKEMYILSLIIVLIAIILIIFLKDDKSYKAENKKEIREENINKKEYIIELFKKPGFKEFLIVSFMNSFVGVAGFFVIPQYLNCLIGEDKMWIIFTPSILISLVIMKKTSKYINKKYIKLVTILSGIAMFLSVLLLINKNSLITISLGTLFIFTGFNILSTVIPVIANKIAEDSTRGLVNGIVNTSVFVGNFVGAALLGILWDKSKLASFVLLGIGAILIIFLGAKSFKNYEFKVKE